MPNFKETSGARQCFMKHQQLQGAKCWEMTRPPLTSVSSSVIPLKAMMAYISVRVDHGTLPLFICSRILTTANDIAGVF